jgi:hypothetical protein
MRGTLRAPIALLKILSSLPDMQILDALPADATGIGAVAAQLISAALDAAAQQHAGEMNALQASLTERESQVAALEERCDGLAQEHAALAQVRLRVHLLTQPVQMRAGSIVPFWHHAAAARCSFIQASPLLLHTRCHMARARCLI